MRERKVGDVLITRVIESERPDFDAGQFFPNITAEQWAPYRQRLSGWAMDTASNGFVFPMQSFLVRTRHHTIVVDTCVGDHKKRVRPMWNMTTSGEFLKRFAETGVRPEDVDYVMCTHMHNDHVGWNTRWENGRWVPTFPKAKYIFTRRSWTYWAGLHKETPQNQIEDSVLPIVEQGRAQLVKNDFADRRRGALRVDRRAHARPRERAHRVEGRGSGDHGRSHPLAGAVPRDGVGAAAGLRSAAGGGHPPGLHGALLRA